jgi:NADH:ubiquinone oxidoreductase subunit H
MFFCVGSFMIFSVLMSGWSSNSKYRLIGSLRSVAQSISYESVFTTLIVLVLFLVSSFRIKSFCSQSSIIYLFFFPIWFICSLAETHRAPFDFRESESELVSGFNTEYSGAYFAFIFLSEYSMLLFSSVLIVWLFFGFLTFFSYFLVISISLVITFLFIWVRITFCRFRYDKLIIFSWKTLLPISIFVFVLFCGISLLI